MSDYQPEYNLSFDKMKNKTTEIEESIDELCNAMNNTFIPDERYQNMDLNKISIYSLNTTDLVNSIQYFDLFYNTSKIPLILLTKNVMNELIKLSSIEELNKYLLNNSDVLQTKDNCYIIYNPIINNDGSKVETHFLLYNVGEVLYNLRINNFQNFIIHPNVIIYNYIYDFIMFKIKNITYHKTNAFINHSIRIKNIGVQYGFILWCYFLMKTKQEYEKINSITDFNKKILDVNTIYDIYCRLKYNPNDVMTNIKKWFI